VPYLDASKVLTSSAVTPTELGYVSGVTSAIQTQISAKAPSASPTFTGTITTPLTASRVVKTNGSSALTTGTVDLTSSNEVTGTLPVANGGTGLTTSFMKVGTYSGNGTTQNVAHGLGVTPTVVIITQIQTGNNNIPVLFITGLASTHSRHFNGSDITNGITGVDSTNISVGANASTNAAGVDYAFLAIKTQ
jgi:hypothetical protein